MERPKYFTPAEVAAHNTTADLWVSFLGKVYDLTPLMEQYKGEDHMETSSDPSSAVSIPPWKNTLLSSALFSKIKCNQENALQSEVLRSVKCVLTLFLFSLISFDYCDSCIHVKAGYPCWSRATANDPFHRGWICWLFSPSVHWLFALLKIRKLWEMTSQCVRDLSDTHCCPTSSPKFHIITNKIKPFRVKAANLHIVINKYRLHTPTSLKLLFF